MLGVVGIRGVSGGMPKGEPSSVGRSFFALASGEIGARIVAFATAIYVARVLGAEFYGAIAFATALLLYLRRVADLGVEYQGPREVAEDPERARGLLLSLTLLRLAASGVLAALLAITASALAPPIGPLLAVYALAMLPAASNIGWMHLGLQRAAPVAAARVAGELFRLALCAVFLRGPDDLMVVPLAHFAGDALRAAILWAALLRDVRPHWVPIRPESLAVVRRAQPLLGAALLGLVMHNSDLLFLEAFRDRSEVGLYAVAYHLMALARVLEGRFRIALLPALVRLGESPERRTLERRSVSQGMALAVPAAVGGFLLAPALIESVFGPGFSSAGSLLQILIWALPAMILRGMLDAMLVARGRNSALLRVTAQSAGVHVVLNGLLIPTLGAPGAAISSVATEWLRSALAHAVLRRRGEISPLAPSCWRPVAASAAMAGLLIVWDPASALLGVAGGGLCYAAVFGATGGHRVFLSAPHVGD